MRCASSSPAPTGSSAATCAFACASSAMLEVVGVTRDTSHDELARGARSGRLRLPSRRREPPEARRTEFVAGNVGLHARRCARRCAGAGAPDSRRLCLVHPGRARQSLRPQQARRRGRCCCDYGRGNRRAGRRLPADQRLRQMGAAELQFGRRDLLPQHRARPADHRQRSSCAAAAGLHRRRRRRASSDCSTTPAQRVGLHARSGRSTRRPSAKWPSTLQSFRRQPDDAADHGACRHRARRARSMPPTSATCRRKHFAYEVPSHADPRGVFVEMLKTPDCGQFSYFTAHPGITRGEHYHHTQDREVPGHPAAPRASAFAISRPARRMRWSRAAARRAIVETVPGWAHDITNIGDDDDRHAVGQRGLRSRASGHRRRAR